MKAVFLSYYFPPLKAPRATQVERLVRHSQLPIRVLCAARNTIPPRGDVEVLHFPDHSPRWWRLIKHFFYLPDGSHPWAMRLAHKVEANSLVQRDDVLVSFGQPMSDHMAGLYLKRRVGMPWIAHFSDPWADNPFQLPIPFSNHTLKRMEREVMSEADLLLFTSWETVDLVMRKYPDSWRKRVNVLPHAFDPALYPTESPKANGKDLIIRYLGNFFWQRNPRALAEAVAILYRTQPRILENVKIELTGRWVGHRRWNPCSLGAPPNLVTLKEPVGYLDSLRLMREADLLMVIDAPFDSNVFFPSKLVDYMGSGRPILAFTPEGTSADIVRALGGWVAPSSSPERMAATLAEAITALRDGRRPSPQEGYVERFSARSVASAFDGLALSISRPSPFPA